jgi:hypothetical protein
LGPYFPDKIKELRSPGLQFFHFFFSEIAFPVSIKHKKSPSARGSKLFPAQFLILVGIDEVETSGNFPGKFCSSGLNFFPAEKAIMVAIESLELGVPPGL